MEPVKSPARPRHLVLTQATSHAGNWLVNLTGPEEIPDAPLKVASCGESVTLCIYQSALVRSVCPAGVKESIQSRRLFRAGTYSLKRIIGCLIVRPVCLLESTPRFHLMPACMSAMRPLTEKARKRRLVI